jgi:hypothetical protein
MEWPSELREAQKRHVWRALQMLPQTREHLQATWFRLWAGRHCRLSAAPKVGMLEALPLLLLHTTYA